MIEEGKFEEEIEKSYNEDIYEKLNELKDSFAIRPFYADIKGMIYDSTAKEIVGGYKVDTDAMICDLRDPDNTIKGALNIRHSFSFYPYVGYNDDNKDPLYVSQLVYIDSLDLYGVIDRNEDKYVINILGAPNSMIRLVNNIKIYAQTKFIMELDQEEIRNVITHNVNILYRRK